MNLVRRLLPLAVLASILGAGRPALAQNIMDEWATVQIPPAPKLDNVTVDPKTTALLMLDFLKQNCAPNPRCMATLPAVQKLLVAARDKKMFVVYTKFPIPGPKPAEILAQVAPVGKEPLVTAFLDKFLNTNLAKTLKGNGIKTVIVVGSASNGAVLFTASSAFAHGYQVIVPVDGLSGKNAYVDQSVVFDFVTAPVMAARLRSPRPT